MDLAPGTEMMWSNPSERRKNLYNRYFSQCVMIPRDKRSQMKQMAEWCTKEYGTPRTGNILEEAMDGWVALREGSWSITVEYSPYDRDSDYEAQHYFWFNDEESRQVFVLTWF
jgi:hypothetical protein